MTFIRYPPPSWVNVVGFATISLYYRGNISCKKCLRNISCVAIVIYES